MKTKTFVDERPARREHLWKLVEKNQDSNQNADLTDLDSIIAQAVEDARVERRAKRDGDAALR